MYDQINQSIQNIDYEHFLAQSPKSIISVWLDKFTKSKELSSIIFRNSFAFGGNPYDFPLNEIYFLLEYFCHLRLFLNERNRSIPLKIYIKKLCRATRGIYNSIIKEIDNLPAYSNHIMASFQAKLTHPAPLVPLKKDFYSDWFRNNELLLPTLQRIVIMDLVRKKILCPRFLKTLNEAYSLGYVEAISDANENVIRCRIAANNVPKVVRENMSYFSPVAINWLRFWLLSMRLEMDALELERNLTQLNGSLLDKMIFVLKHFSGKLKGCQKLCQINPKMAEYELEYSCLFVDYLIAVANLAIRFGLLTSEQINQFAFELRIHSINAEFIVRTASG